MKTRTTWALGLVTMVLVGCGESSARPAAQPPAAAVTAASPPCAATAPAVSAAPAMAVNPPATAPVPSAPAAVKTAPEVTTRATATLAKASATEAKLSVKRLVLAEGVKGREPVNAATTFSAKEAGKIYAFVEVENNERVPSEVTVSFEPSEGGASRGNITLAVGAEPRWRTWAFTRTARAAGAWTAVVKDKRGEVLARAPFQVTL